MCSRFEPKSRVDLFAPAVVFVGAALSSQRDDSRGNMACVYTVHATKKLLDRLKEPVEVPVVEPTTKLGNWYAKPLFWKPQVALFINETTFLSVLVPLAPASTLLRRFPIVVAMTLEAHGVPRSFISAEIDAMQSVGVSKTQSRQLVGVLNELAFQADISRRLESETSELAIAMMLSRTPIGIMGKSYRFPDQALATVVEATDHVGPDETTSTTAD